MEAIKRFFTMEESISPDYYDSLEHSLEDYGVTSTPELEVTPTRGQVIQPRKGSPVSSMVHNRPRSLNVQKPSQFSDAKNIARILQEHHMVIVNMRKLDRDLSRRIVDFLSGIAFSMDGSSQKIAEQMFLFTSSEFEINMDQASSLSQEKSSGDTSSIRSSGSY